MRRAAPFMALLLAGASAQAGQDCAALPIEARYGAPTDRYPHGALGDPLEWGALEVTVSFPSTCAGASATLDAVLPEALVFEDVAPRLADLDGDGVSEIITVESHQDSGARLAVWGLRDGALTRLAATPHIGTRFRWLAPLGAADLDGDGAVEVAYVDRPHLARVLRVWRWQEGGLVEVAAVAGVTNHRFGDPEISGGIRDCGAGPEMIVADADWRRVLALSLRDGDLRALDLGAIGAARSLDGALACRF